MKTAPPPLSPHTRRPLAAFTLIELLVVISIIAILMAMAVPAVGNAIDSARRAAAQNDVTQIANAVTMFINEYGRMPSDSPTGDVSGELLATLIGENDTNNPRRIVMLQANTIQQIGKGRSGIKDGTFYDPWGNVYKIALDTDYDNKVEALGETIRRQVAVWNEPQDPNPAKQRRQQVKSW